MTNEEKLIAEAIPHAQPCQGMTERSTSMTPAAKIVPVNSRMSENSSGRVGKRRFAIQSNNMPIHVNWNSMTTASEAGMYSTACPYTVPVVAVNKPAKIKVFPPPHCGLDLLKIKKSTIAIKSPT